MVSCTSLHPKCMWLNPMCWSLFMRDKLAEKCLERSIASADSKISQCPHTPFNITSAMTLTDEMPKYKFWLFFWGGGGHSKQYMCDTPVIPSCVCEWVGSEELLEARSKWSLGNKFSKARPPLVMLLLRHDKPMLLMSTLGALRVEVTDRLLLDVPWATKINVTHFRRVFI